MNYFSVKKYAATIAEDAGLGLDISSKHSCPHTDCKTVFMPEYDWRWEPTDPKAVDWWFALIHECWHNNFPEDFVMIRENKINMDMSKPFPFVLNLVVDHNIEYCKSGEYAGRLKKLEAAHNNHIKRCIKNFGKDSENVLRNMFEALFAWDSVCRAEWMQSHRGYDVSHVLNDIGKEFYDKLIAANLIDEMVSERDAEGNYQLAKKIIDALGLDADEEEQKAQQPESGDEEGEGNGGEQGEGEGDEGEDQGDEGEGKGNGEGEGESKKGVKATVKY